MKNYSITKKVYDCASIHPGIVTVVACLLSLVFTLNKYNGIFPSVIGFSVIFVVGLCLKQCNKLDNRAIIVLLFAAGFILRLQYVLYTGCMERQHDVEVFGSGHGHSGYIEYIYNNSELYYGDVRDIWQFYHPPLHHIICAITLKIFNLLKVEYALACENLQILSLFYSSISMLISYKILREFRLSFKATAIAFSVIAFHPTFIIFAGSINNDILSITLQLAAILYTLRWYRSRSLSNIIKIALCIGFGMLAKLSAWMIAPAVAFVFLYTFITDLLNKRRKFTFYLKQYSVFGIVCFPLGLWWSIRNAVLFSVPANYVPLLNFDNPQYIGFHSVFKRLFDFGGHQFKSVFDMWGEPYYEYNPTVGLFKTAMFGESINGIQYPQINTFGTMLFWLGTILALIAFISMLYFFFKDKKDNNITNLFMFIIAGLITVMYYYFCIKFSFTCTQNIRYAAPLIVIGVVYLAKTIEKLQNKEGSGPKILSTAITALVCLFCAFSALIYVIIGV